MSERIVDVAPMLNEQKYMVVFDINYGDNSNTVTVYAENLEKAYSLAVNANKFFDADDKIQKVSFVGVYKRIGIKIVEEGE